MGTEEQIRVQPYQNSPQEALHIYYSKMIPWAFYTISSHVLSSFPHFLQKYHMFRKKLTGSLVHFKAEYEGQAMYF